MTHIETQWINGKEIAQKHLERIRQEIQKSLSSGNKPPCLAVILVGDDPASQVYVGHKQKACERVGILSQTHRLPQSATFAEVKSLVSSLNKDPSVHGVLLQLPLPPGLRTHTDELINLIDSTKDVDGLSAFNQGLLARGTPSILPCTPKGVMCLLKESGIDISGKHAVVVGRSILVGSPMARMLLLENATVTQIHSKTKNPKALTKQADILVVAAGVAHLVDGSWLKPGAVVIDVGMHRSDSGLCGDVEPQSCLGIAYQMSPVPGGVGPMTIAMLIENTWLAWHRQCAPRTLIF